MALDFSKELMGNPDMMNVPLIQCWRGRILCYAGQEAQGKKILQDAIRVDPDLTDAMRTIKALKLCATRKEEAGQIFQAQNFDEAINAFD